MPRTVALTHEYPGAGAAEVWDLVVDLDALAGIMAGLMRFDGLPSGRIRQGDTYEVEVRLFGWMPPQAYRMHVAECDDAARRFVSEESGAGVRSWQHRLQVEQTGTGARIIENITVDAGWLTPLFARWARYVYRYRHPRRLALLAAGDRHTDRRETPT